MPPPSSSGAGRCHRLALRLFGCWAMPPPSSSGAGRCHRLDRQCHRLDRQCHRLDRQCHRLALRVLGDATA
ncbi:hypothetical protein C4D60_Mb07t10860 [Musa balbisiana]|uniref:Uncharacterized protein n=1 Tax=Musa balbisiana TaxID=52838 RepID=A0A4S8JEM6_MUSBA|nr:hypothetical protein C4D60_Mb07t10860 [Musa balbisiana]